MKNKAIFMLLLGLMVSVVAIYTAFEIYLRQDIAMPKHTFQVTEIEALEAEHGDLAIMFKETNNSIDWLIETSTQHVNWLFTTVVVSVMVLLSMLGYCCFLLGRSSNKSSKRDAVTGAPS